ncbi:MAG TPA: T9SS type A sorting domain-containing protein, partial [Bacteroidota bacterium]
LNFANVEVAGNVTANTTPEDHAEIDSAGIRIGRKAHRFWTMTPSLGFDYTSYSITLQFDEEDIDPESKTKYYVVRRYNDTTWVPTANGVRTDSTTQGLNNMGMSDFSVGQQRPARLELFSGNNQAGIIGNQLPFPFVVEVLDKFSISVPDASVDWGFNDVPDDALNQSLSETTILTDDNGLAGSTMTVGDKVGPYSVLVLAQNEKLEDLIDSPTFYSATGNVGAASSIEMTSGDGQIGIISTQLSAPFTVTVRDVGGNPVAGVNVAFSIGSAPLGATGQSMNVPGILTDINGRASAVLTLGNLNGVYTVLVTSGSLQNSPITFTASAIGGGGPTSVTSLEVIPTEFQLFQNYPNPFNPSTKIRFGVPEESNVSVVVYNLLGVQVAELVNSEIRAGTFETVWLADGFASGTYIVRMKAVGVNSDQSFSSIRKVVLLK